MAEGQVSHRNVIRMSATIVGHAIVRVDESERVAAQRIGERLRGDVLDRVRAVGKHHLMEFASGRVLHSHLGMNGSWRVYAAAETPPTGRMWLALWTDTHVAAQYGGPRISLFEPGEPIPSLGRVGPDLLGQDGLPDPDVVLRLDRLDPDRLIGDVLLDQRVVSGIGNIYRAETLFLCGVDPWRNVGSVDPDTAAELGRTAARLLSEGVASPGPITTHRDPGGRRGERTWVYGRRDKPCRRCASPIRSRGMGDANRTVYWCPTCQT